MPDGAGGAAAAPVCLESKTTSREVEVLKVDKTFGSSSPSAAAAFSWPLLPVARDRPCGRAVGHQETKLCGSIMYCFSVDASVHISDD